MVHEPGRIATTEGALRITALPWACTTVARSAASLSVEGSLVADRKRIETTLVNRERMAGFRRGRSADDQMATVNERDPGDLTMVHQCSSNEGLIHCRKDLLVFARDLCLIHNHN